MSLERIVADCNPSQLETEIRQIQGFPPDGTAIYKRTDTGDYLVQVLPALTTQQITELGKVIARHVPDKSLQITEAEITQLRIDIDSSLRTWAVLTTTQKVDAVKKLLELELKRNK